MDGYIIAHDDAKRRLSVAVYNHYKRITLLLDDEIDLEKRPESMSQMEKRKFMSPNSKASRDRKEKRDRERKHKADKALAVLDNTL